MEFGHIEKAAQVLELCKSLIKFCVNDAETAAVETARGWAKDFLPVAELVKELDAARPKPAYVFKTVSPTVFANVGTQMGLQFESVRAPEVVWVKEFVLGKMMWVPEIKWPEGTLHNTSKFAWGSKAGNSQCEACGHAIRRNDNWVPLLLDSVGNPPTALWVGKDCAKTLFGCVIQGTAIFNK